MQRPVEVLQEVPLELAFMLPLLKELFVLREEVKAGGEPLHQRNVEPYQAIGLQVKREHVELNNRLLFFLRQHVCLLTLSMKQLQMPTTLSL